MTQWNMSKMFKYCYDNDLDLPIKGQKYKNTNTKYKYFCNMHKRCYLQKWNSHRLGMTGCTLCHSNRVSISKTKYSMATVMEECLLKNYDIPQRNQKYITTKTKYIFVCPTHGEYKQTWEKHKEGQGCPKCCSTKISNKKTKTFKCYYQECLDKELDPPIENYKADIIKVNHRCRICGNIYKQTPSNHLRGQGCPLCTQPKGERFIKNYLDTHSIPYETQKKFNDLKDKRLLSYDFYLPKQDTLIEYQGIQHFAKGGKGLFSRNYFPIQQYHDTLKRGYAKKHGYTLLEPTYKLDTQEKINNYFDKQLKMQNVPTTGGG